ncbi:hypothetical protein DFP72DRAFT_1050514 [Ephemerocybe angulata]|uniref:Protein PBN1 n=1 Tax=Ephemerocybe angulata TaxID=980116 RepID=A0A8H6HIC1_9AGAR|nr:hypothetical protein DFP72DRAFT_1050514 [Tulosesus angulatus]
MASKLSTNSTLDPAYGSHPSIIPDIHISLHPRIATPHLFLHYELPPLLFVDPYELEMRDAEYQLLGTRGRVNEGEEEEAIGVEVVIQRKLPTETTGSARVQLPVHVRYGEPVASSTSKPYIIQEFSGPTVVLACGKNPNFYWLPSQPRLGARRSAAQSPEQSLAISAPLGNTLDLPTVELGTTAVVLACFAWVS